MEIEPRVFIFRIQSEVHAPNFFLRELHPKILLSPFLFHPIFRLSKTPIISSQNYHILLVEINSQSSKEGAIKLQFDKAKEAGELRELGVITPP